ncbi:MAG: NAD-dependent epimerase/dehydratase family protein [Egibacteraceae bacterium]
MSGARIVVTGAAGALTTLVAGELARRPEIEQVIAVDRIEPRSLPAGVSFERADLTTVAMRPVLESAQADTLVHLALTAAPAASGGRARMKERNVIGTMQLLAAAEHSPTITKVVMRSTTAVYGSSSADPALFDEDVIPDAPPRSGYSKDAVEIEGYVRAFSRRRPDVTVTLLRCANMVGSKLDTIFQRHLALPVVPTVLGYDPRVQLLHQDDAVAVIAQAVTGTHPGVYNVAGTGIVYLSQAARLAGRAPLAVPGPLVEPLAGLARRAGLLDVSGDQLRFLLYGRVADITRLRERFGFQPRYSTRAALTDLVERGVIDPVVDPANVAAWERALQGLLGRRLAGLSRLMDTVGRT